MDVSSTTMTSCARRFNRLCRKRRAVGGVEAEQAVQRDASELQQAGCVPRSRRTASQPPRALPPGGGPPPSRSAPTERRADGRCPRAAACSSRSTSTRATVVVLPVPGPPAMTEKRRSTADAAASLWRSGCSSLVNSRASPVGEQPDVHAIGRRAREGQEVAGHLLFLGPVAVEVERRPLQVERPIEARRAGRLQRGRSSRLRPARGALAGRPPRGPRLAVVRIVARSTQTWPSRGARTAKAAPSRTASSPVSPSSPRRVATCTSAAVRTPASLNSRNTPEAPRARRMSYRVGRQAGSRILPTPVEQIAQGRDQRPRRPPGPHAARLAVDLGPCRAAHPPQEQVERPAQVPLRVVSRDPPAQVPVQGDGVQQRLQRVMGGLHLRQHGGWTGSPRP